MIIDAWRVDEVRSAYINFSYKGIPEPLHAPIRGGVLLIDDRPGIEIRSLEGETTAEPGDWLMRGEEGEFYPCKPDIFDETYDFCPEYDVAERLIDGVLHERHFENGEWVPKKFDEEPTE